MYKIFNFTIQHTAYGTSENLFPTKSEILIIYFTKEIKESSYYYVVKTGPGRLKPLYSCCINGNSILS